MKVYGKHETVADLLTRTDGLRTKWRTDADGSRAAYLATLYTHLHDALVEHLDAEERCMSCRWSRHA